jgi:hypothetical protein
MIDALLLAATLMTSHDMQHPASGTYAQVVRQAAEIPARHRSWAACVLDRESGGVLHDKQSGERAKNPHSSAQGRWQFLSAWQSGGSYMVRDRLVQFGMPKDAARHVRKWLGSRPIAHWDGYWQDTLFNEVVERGGKHHWNGGGHAC